MLKAAIVDLDGTLANTDHRQHYMEAKKKDWKNFYAEMVNDQPNHDILWIVESWANRGVPILLCTGRPEEYRPFTVGWLERFRVPYHKLYMRQTGDFRADDIIKLELLAQMQTDGFDPNIALDDRDRVVKAWRAVGIRCLQVADGDF